MTTAGNGQRGFNFYRSGADWLERNPKVTARQMHEVLDKLFPYKEQGAGQPVKQVTTPVKPLKKHFPVPTNKTLEFDAGDGFIRLDDKSRTFHWNVPENNHAVEHAHAHPVAIAAFKELDRMTNANLWTRCTGGTCWGSDEYRDEANQDDYGASDSRISKHYGPLGHERRARSMGMSFTRYRSLKLDQPIPIRPTSRFEFGPRRSR